MRHHRFGIGSLGLALAAAVGLLASPLMMREARACDPGPDYGPEEVQVETSGKRKRVKLNYRREELTFAGGHRNLAEIQIFTKNKRLVKWLKKHGMGSKMWKAVKKTASRADCSTLLSGKKLSRLERALKAAVIRHYRARTRKSPGKLDIMLVTEQDQSGSDLCLPPTRGRIK